MTALKLELCHGCRKRPIRVRPRSQESVWFCMGCAQLKGKLQAEDYDPEPEGFREFVSLMNQGPEELATE